MAGVRRKSQDGTQTSTEAAGAGERHHEGALVPVTARGEATRRRILDAAEAVFGDRGYHEASVTEITQRAQVAQGTFYLYFHSKREIFLQLVEDLGTQLRAAMREASRGSTSRMEMERKGFAGFFAFARAHRQLYRIVQEADRVDLPTFQEYYSRLARGYARGLGAAMEAGEIRQIDPEALAYALIGIGHFLALRWLIWPQEQSSQIGQPAEEIAGEAGGQPPELPERVFSTLLEFLAHGLEP
ncbi:MAG TPA: TetR/AcrR family transcriptional regulator [Ktedonobacterales bacterium]|jgi:AcrR family transcriptional regulator